jgi:hypothetical protein
MTDLGDVNFFCRFSSIFGQIQKKKNKNQCDDKFGQQKWAF